MNHQLERAGIRGCRLGYEEHDGARYCFEHFGFRQAYGDPWCDQAPGAPRDPNQSQRRQNRGT